MGAKLVISIITLTAATIGLVPPIISFFGEKHLLSIKGNSGDVSIGGSVNKNYFSYWVEGTKIIFNGDEGNNPGPSHSSPDRVKLSGLPEPGSTGGLINNASLLNGMKWSPLPASIDRYLEINFFIEAPYDENKFSSADVTLYRNDVDVCTLSLNSKTSAGSYGNVRWAQTTCKDHLPAKETWTYKARVSSNGMEPFTIRISVVATEIK